MIYNLPVKLEIGNKEFDIRSDFRAILDLIIALNDPSLTNQEKSIVILQVMYPDWKQIQDYQEAIKQAMWFISCGNYEFEDKPKAILMDWEQDFKLIVAPINRVLGYECRQVDYLHWWSFISAYYEIGECAFSNVINIRNKRKR